MNPNHPDPCASFGETAEALRALITLKESISYLAQRILAGAHDGCCDAYQALQATDLGRDLKVLGCLLDAVEPAAAKAATAPIADQEAA